MSYTFGLTEENEAMLAAVRDAWLAGAASTERCDRPAAEASVAAAYTSAGLAPPRTVVWMDSPLGGALAAYGLRHGISAAALRRLVVGDIAEPVLDRVEAQLRAQLPDGSDDLPDDGRDDRDAVRSGMFDAFYGTGAHAEPLCGPLLTALRLELEGHLGGPLTDPFGAIDGEGYDAVELWDVVRSRMRPLEDRLGDGPGRSVAGRLFRDLQPRLPEDLRRRLRAEVQDVSGFPPDPDGVRFWHAFGGQLDPWGNAAGLAMVTAALPMAGLAPSPRLDALVAAVRSLGWWWPRSTAVVLTDRPTELRLKRSGTPRVMAYADGYRPVRR